MPMDENREANGHFKKGVSGNPGGRPAILEEVRDYARQYTKEAIDVLVGIMRNQRLPAQARVAASSAVLDRGFGKPQQAISTEVVQRFEFELPAEAVSEAAWLTQSDKVIQ